MTETSDATYAVQAAFGQQPFSCPKCGVVSEFYKHGTLLQRVNDTTHAGKPVVILWDRQRYRCRACSATFLQPSTDIDDNHLMTKRLVVRGREVQRALPERDHRLPERDMKRPSPFKSRSAPLRPRLR